MLNLGIIGTFWLTDEFIKALGKSKDIRYYAQYSRSYEKAVNYGKEKGATVFYDDLEKMAKDPNIDAVYIASPNMLHYKQSKLFIKAKKHVICEKPVTVTLDEFNELSEIADKNEVIYMEAMLNIHIDWVKELKELINLSGKTICARFDFNQRSSKLEKVKKGERISSFDKNSCGGALMDLGVYCTSLATYLFGYPEEVYAKAHYSEQGSDLSDTVVLGYKDFECVCTLSKLCESVARSEILCSDTVITMKNVSQIQQLELTKNGNKTLIHGVNGFPDSMIYEINDFVSYINGNKKSYLENRNYTAMSIKLLEKIREQIRYNINSEI